MIKLIKKTLLIPSAILLSFVILSAQAIDPVYTGFFSNQAIKGYDTVAYFTDAKAVKGQSEFKTQYQGATWLFASQEHLTLFTANPEKYVPQYGGYCAYAVAQNTTASIKPELFSIVDDKLYLNYNEEINTQWRGNRAEYIKLADGYWPGLIVK